MIKRHFIYAGVSIAGLVLFATATTLILLAVNPKKDTSSSIAKTHSPAQIIVAYRGLSIDTKKSAAYTEQQNGSTGAVLIEKPSGATFAVNITSSDYVNLRQTDIKASLDQKSTLSAAETFFVSQGLAKATAFQQNNSTFTSFTNNTVICQTQSTEKTGVVSATITLVCTTRIALEDEYTSIKTLLSQSGQTAISSVATDIKRVIIKDTAYTATILYIKNKDTAEHITRLYFIATDKAVTYLGMQTSTNGSTASTVVKSPELTLALTDKNYGKFLTSLIEKY